MGGALQIFRGSQRGLHSSNPRLPLYLSPPFIASPVSVRPTMMAAGDVPLSPLRPFHLAGLKQLPFGLRAPRETAPSQSSAAINRQIKLASTFAEDRPRDVAPSVPCSAVAHETTAIRPSRRHGNRVLVGRGQHL